MSLSIYRNPPARRLYIQDPVHHRIDLTPYRQVLDSPPVQRMKHIKQLGGAWYVWQGAVHTRLNHMVGTAFITLERAIWLARQGYLSEDDIRLLVVSALVHDVGHWSFSHFMERCFGDHNTRGLDIIRGPLAQYIRMCGVDPEEVAEVCARTHRLSDIIFPNPIGADKLDYLARDAYFALGESVKLQDLYMYEVSWDRREGLFVLPNGIPTLMRAIEQSWHMFTDLYEHPNTRVVQRAIQELLRQMVEVDPIIKERLFAAGEDAVMGAIGYWCEDPKNKDHECVERYRRLEMREHPQKALLYSADPNLTPVDAHEGLIKLECASDLATKSQLWTVPKVAELERQLAEIIGTTPPRVSLAVAPPPERWKVPKVKVLDNGSVHLIGDLQPGMHKMADEKARMVQNVVVAVDEPLRPVLAGDSGLQRAIRELLESA